MSNRDSNLFLVVLFGIFTTLLMGNMLSIWVNGIGDLILAILLLPSYIIYLYLAHNFTKLEKKINSGTGTKVSDAVGLVSGLFTLIFVGFIIYATSGYRF